VVIVECGHCSRLTRQKNMDSRKTRRIGKKKSRLQRQNGSKKEKIKRVSENDVVLTGSCPLLRVKAVPSTDARTLQMFLTIVVFLLFIHRGFSAFYWVKPPDNGKSSLRCQKNHEFQPSGTEAWPKPCARAFPQTARKQKPPPHDAIFSNTVAPLSLAFGVMF